ncbi:MAG: CoB--CoM heterodisulfide reductase iron-sulfur subunit A family protein [Bacteroidetes bacterium]|nr:CoB--CoM heterodisulfide reductase iron-sulfur subunit A family protein [Bacteroidota bacterium]MBT5989633.1 CoB--CoM heterodisulfide reductase iron-sulfur subunit A family protein [Bacteroidota bacterium]MBT7041390.1 CoB--CoM heterodisulfide reductase iron-sulfur subunit A family protein [Bacteroidota bacterium]MBT7824968.1 CoB--CoM heterodisulfide reductase iron-sulfur subunit A family protein [Bacteroidota bacterium]
MEEIRIGVYVCWCGTNIAKMVDVEKVSEEIASLPNVALSKTYKYMCSDPGQDLIVKDIKENKLNRIVVAACSPRIHELTFRKALENAGLNPYMFEMANIREQVSWVHLDRDAATKKAKSLLAAAINKVQFHEALEKRSVEIDSKTMIIGGGVAGISAALEIANSGRQVYLIEKSDKLGGHAKNIDLTFPYFQSAQQMLAMMIKSVENNEKIEVFFNSEVDEVFGYIGNFKSTINNRELEFGNVIVATGLKSIDPTNLGNYAYNRLPDVLTSVEFEKMLQKGEILTKEGKTPKNIAVIHCVGSRNEITHEYCSRNCCMTALKFSNQIKSTLPDTNVFELYSDMRAFGKGCEELYTKTSRQGVVFLMFDQKDEMPTVVKASKGSDCSMYVIMEERLSGESVEVPADLVVLMVGVEAQVDAKKIAHAVGISMCGNDFYIEKHPKLDPVATTTDGVYIVGGCQGPKDIPDSVSQAKAAAARVLATINQGKVFVEVTTAVVNEDQCCGCQTCVNVCPYTAISYNEEKNVSYVNEILCKGCGTCGSACPSGAIASKHFTDKQIMSQIEGLMEMYIAEEAL